MLQFFYLIFMHIKIIAFTQYKNNFKMPIGLLKNNVEKYFTFQVLSIYYYMQALWFFNPSAALVSIDDKISQMRIFFSITTNSFKI